MTDIHEKTKYKRKHNRKPVYKKTGFYLLILMMVSLFYIMYQLYRFNALPFIAVFIFVDIEAVFFFIVWYLMISRHRKKFKISGGIIAAMLCLFNLFLGFQIQRIVGTIEQMNDAQLHKHGNFVELYVMRDSTIEALEELNGRKVGIMISMPDRQSAPMLTWIDENGIEIELKEYESSLKMVNDLKGRVLDAVILFQPNLSIIEEYEGLENFHNEVRSLHQIEVDGVKLGEPANLDVTTTPFSLLISGIDTYGEASAAGRSDVNILITVNPNSRQIYMLSIPRDLYVTVQNDETEDKSELGKLDKLTHTGIYGIEVTKKTIENLLSTEINYVARVNFTTLVQLVDDVGGIDVENPNDFSIGDKHFSQGTVHLDGESALSFSRARYAFIQGDRERGRNQMRVIEAILNKVMSPALLKSYDSILETISESVQMNIGAEEIASLVNMQLSKPSSWNVYSYSLTGSDANEYSPALGDNAYVMILDENALLNAKQDLTAIRNGEKPLFVN